MLYFIRNIGHFADLKTPDHPTLTFFNQNLHKSEYILRFLIQAYYFVKMSY